MDRILRRNKSNGHFDFSKKTRPNSLIDRIASSNGYRQNNDLLKLTYLLLYSSSRDAIASKKLNAKFAILFVG